MYDILAYGRMIKDPVRFHAFTEALRWTVKPGSAVLDVGTGPGIMALLACKFGARRVYAIESDPVINVAREIAISNGFAGQIEFVEGLSTQVSLPERVNVIVSDLNGTLPWFQQHLRSVADARQRFLAPGGVMIPKKEIVWLGVAESQPAYAEHTQPWEAGHGFRNARRPGPRHQHPANGAAPLGRPAGCPAMWGGAGFHAGGGPGFQG